MATNDFGYIDDMQGPTFYDTDQGNKMTLATRVNQSPIRYSIMRSTAPKLSVAPHEEVPFGAYNIDKGSKKTLESTCRDSRRFYSSSFDSKVPRFTRPWSSPNTDLLYLPDRTMNYAPISIGKAVEETAVRYSILRSRYKRFPDKPILSEAPDITYDVDCHLAKNRATLATEVKNSPISYRNMGFSQSAKAASVRRDGYAAHLGPGSYDYKHPNDLRASVVEDKRPLSSMVSGVGRFNNTSDPSKGLGSSWRPERDAVNWGRGTTISKTEVLRPQYLPKSYAGKD